MADFIQYTPTASLTAEERTPSEYFNAIREWVISLDAMKQFFEVEEDDPASSSIVMKPKFDNIKNFPIKFMLYGTNFKLLCSAESNDNTLAHIWSNESYASVNTNGYKNDIKFDVFCDGNTFIISNASLINYENYFMITDAIDIDSNSKFKIAIYMYNTTMYIAHTGASSVYIGDSMYRVMKSQFNYLLRPVGVPGTALLCDNVYALDAGNAVPSVGRVKINNKYYYKLLHNLIFKMD